MCVCVCLCLVDTADRCKAHRNVNVRIQTRMRWQWRWCAERTKKYDMWIQLKKFYLFCARHANLWHPLSLHNLFSISCGFKVTKLAKTLEIGSNIVGSGLGLSQSIVWMPHSSDVCRSRWTIQLLPLLSSLSFFFSRLFSSVCEALHLYRIEIRCGVRYLLAFRSDILFVLMLRLVCAIANSCAYTSGASGLHKFIWALHTYLNFEFAAVFCNRFRTDPSYCYFFIDCSSKGMPGHASIPPYHVDHMCDENVTVICVVRRSWANTIRYERTFQERNSIRIVLRVIDLLRRQSLMISRFLARGTKMYAVNVDH